MSSPPPPPVSPIPENAIIVGSTLNMVMGSQYNNYTTAPNPAVPNDANITMRCCFRDNNRCSRVAVLAIACCLGALTITIVPTVVVTERDKHKSSHNASASTTTPFNVSNTSGNAPTSIPFNVPSDVPSNVSLSGGIEYCPGGPDGRALVCMFEPDSAQANSTKNLASILGVTLENCYGGNSSVTETLGGSAIITQWWSGPPDDNQTFAFLNIVGNYWDSSNTWNFEQSVNASVGPGDQVALVINVPNNVTTGRMLLQYPRPVNGSAYWYINDVHLYRPTNNIDYFLSAIPCSATYDLPYAPSYIPVPLAGSESALHHQLNFLTAVVPIVVTLLFVIIRY